MNDPNADYGELWAAVHDYVIAQNSQDAGVIARAYTRMLEAHNLIHDRYVVERGIPEPAGVVVSGSQEVLNYS